MAFHYQSKKFVLEIRPGQAIFALMRRRLAAIQG